MKTRKVLCPTDFSEYTNAALRYASTLAAESGAKLYIVYVDERVHSTTALGEVALGYGPWEDENRSYQRSLLSNVKPTLPQVGYEHRFLAGEAVHEIVDFAKREHIDLIVMGSHGRTGLSRLLMGSVAEGVARRAPCPVLIVKHPVKESEEAADACGVAVTPQ